jgi:hypothetical protein
MGLGKGTSDSVLVPPLSDVSYQDAGNLNRCWSRGAVILSFVFQVFLLPRLTILYSNLSFQERTRMDDLYYNG